MTNPNDLEPGTQSGAALATALGLMAVLIEELVRAGAAQGGMAGMQAMLKDALWAAWQAGHQDVAQR